MPFKFEKLEVWELALAYLDSIYDIAGKLPRNEEHNIKSQITRAATSVVLNIAEGSIGQTDIEQARFLGLAIRSLVETVACQHIISKRKFLADPAPLRQAYRDAELLVAKLHALRKTIAPALGWIREDNATYEYDLSPLEDEQS
jgi:four helix bundle protein